MSTKKKGVLITDGDWRKHLRPYFKKVFWGRHRAKTKQLIYKEDKRNG